VIAGEWSGATQSLPPGPPARALDVQARRRQATCAQEFIAPVSGVWHRGCVSSCRPVPFQGLVNLCNHKPGYVKCLHEEFKFLLELTGITTELLEEHPNFAATAALEGIVEGARKTAAVEPPTLRLRGEGADDRRGGEVAGVDRGGDRGGFRQ
jgi:hypothetical protein